MKKLPKIYKTNSNIKDTNRKSFHITKTQEIINNDSIEEVLYKIFNGLGHPYNIKVFIKTNYYSKETYIVSKTKDSITTLDNMTIPIKDIISLNIK